AFAVGSAGTILHYMSGSWSAMTSGTSNDLYDIWGSSEQNIYAVGQDGIILHYDGNQWTEQNSPVSETLYAIDGISTNRLFAAGQNGTIIQYAPKNQITPITTTSDPIVLTINESDPDYLSVTIAWSNTELLTTTCFQIEGTVGNVYEYAHTTSQLQALTLLITPLTGISGESVITITVTDAAGLTAVETFTFVAQQGPSVFQNIQTIGSGYEHSLGINNTGQLMTWGNNERGGLGIGTYGAGQEKQKPTPVDHTGRFIAVDGGTSSLGRHSIGLKADGSVWTWGSNSFGQIGNASSGTDRYTPYNIVSLSNITQVAAGNEHNIALKASGQVWSWGRNTEGQLGLADNSDRYTPVMIPGLNMVQQIAAGGNFSMALKRDGTVWAWGENTYGQSGTGDTMPNNTPTQVVGISGIGFLSQIVAISAGTNHALALKNSGTVYAWGWGMSGRLGNNMDGSNLTSPALVLSPTGIGLMRNVIKIAAGYSHSMLLKSDGTVWAFGEYMNGRLGDTYGMNQLLPAQVKNSDNSGYLRNVIDISCSGMHSMALINDGTLVAWGANSFGQVGNNDMTDQWTPVEVTNMSQTQERSHFLIPQNTPSTPIQLFMSHTSVGAISVTVTSSNSNLIPVDQITVQSTGYAISANGQIVSFTLTVTPTNNTSGSSTLCVIATDADGYSGALYMTIGVIGPPTLTPFSDVTMNQNSEHTIDFIMSDANLPATSLDVTIESSNETVFSEDSITYEGTGENQILYLNPEPHQAGFAMITITVANDLTSTSQSFGVTVLEVDDPPDISQVPFKLSAGYNHTMALDTDFMIWTWGNNYSGQLGIGSGVSQQLTPVHITDLSEVISIASGWNTMDGNHSLAVKTDGTVWAWGVNDYGQLGIGEATSDRYTPVNTVSASNIIDVAAGGHHSLALKNDGTVWAWGYNMSGQIGDGTSAGGNDRYTPVQVINLTDVAAIAAGSNHSLALKSDGTVWAWGEDSEGQLGDNSITPKSTPVQVVDSDGIGYLEDIIAIDAGDRHSLALKSDGTVWAWGANNSGELGQNSNSPSYQQIPVQVYGINGIGKLTNIIDISTGFQHTLALRSDGRVVSWGSNTYGQLGNESNTVQYAPVLVSMIGNIQTIEAGGLHSAAIQRDGTVWTWGYNSSGELGNNTTTEYNYPIHPSGSSGIFKLGTFLPSEITIAEDTQTYVCFQISDPEGGQITLWVDSSDQNLVANDQFVFSGSEGSAIENIFTLTVTAFQTVDITLTFTGNYNQIGSADITIYASDGNSTSTHLMELTIQNLPDVLEIILKSEWKDMESNTDLALYGIWALNSQCVYAAGENGIILKYDGNNWTEESYGMINYFNDIWGINKDDIIAGGAGMLRYNGSSWIDDSANNEDINAIWANNTNFFTVGNGEVLKYNMGWTDMTSGIIDSLYSVYENSTHLYVAAEYGIIYQYANSTWSSITLDTEENLMGIWVNDQTGFVVGTGGAIFKRNNTQWTEMNSDTTIDLNAVWASSAQNVYAVGNLGDVYYYNGTEPWILLEVPTDDDLYDIFGLTANRIFACGDYGIIIQKVPVDYITALNTASEPISITLVEPDAEYLTITFAHSNASLLTSTSFVFNEEIGYTHTLLSTASQNEVLTLTIHPITNQSGTSSITITVTDSNGYTSVEFFTFTVSKGPLIYHNIKTVSAGYRHSMGIQSDGQIMSWGSNDSGELGIATAGASANKISPVETHTTGRFIAVQGGQNDMYNHSIALKFDGTVWTWGSNEYGQIGDGNFGILYDQHEPTQVETLSDIVSVDAGQKHSLALDRSGNVWVWGSNMSGQLGTSNSLDYSIPVSLSGLPEIEAIAAGKEHSLALTTDGYVWAWGYNYYGQLGTNDFVDHNYPAQVMAPSGSGFLSNIVAIAAGSRHSLALKNDGSVWAWGNAEYGRLGNNIMSGFYELPMATRSMDGTSNLTNIIAITAGHEHSMALKNDGKVYAWGRSQYGRLGNGDSMDTSYSLPVWVMDEYGTEPLTNIVAINAGGMHSMALDSSGQLYAWGYNDKGQLGDNTTAEHSYPMMVYDFTDGKTESHLAIPYNQTASFYHLLLTNIEADTITLSAISSNPSLIANSSIVFNDSQTTFPLTSSGKIVDITLSLTPETDQAGHVSIAIIATDSHNISSTSFMHLMVMGQPTISAISNVSLTENTSSEVIPFTITDSVVDASDLIITQSSSNTDLIPLDKISFGGDNQSRTVTITPETQQAGVALITITVSNGVISVTETFTVTVIGQDDPPVIETNGTKIVGSYSHSLALAPDGHIWVWGNNSVGQLGITPLSDQYTPVQMTAIDSVVDIAASINTDHSNHSLAVKSDGTVWAWGYNSAGQLGNNDCCVGTANSVTPVHVLNISDITKVAAGGLHSMALESNGKVWTWGRNYDGQLGIGTSGPTADCYSPVQVSGLSNVENIAAGGNHSMALLQDGTVWTWGLNGNGQLGDNSILERNTPVQVVGPGGSGFLEDIIAIGAGDQHSVALRNDGTVWAWGTNSNAQLGQGTTYMYSQYPVQVFGINSIGKLINVKSISVGSNHTIALLNDGTVVAWGQGSYGQLGNYTNSDQIAPVEVNTIDHIQMVSTGGNHSFAIESDGTVWSWGSNTNYQLGDGTMMEQNHPVQPEGNDSENYFNIGTYFPSTLSMSEDTVATVQFSLVDPDSSFLTLVVSSSNQDILKDSKLNLISSDNQGNPLIQVVSAGVPLPLTLSIQPESNRNGVVVITLDAYDATGLSTQTLTLTIQDVADQPDFSLDCQWSLKESPVNTTLYGVWALNENLAYAVGDNNVILKYNGDQWESVPHNETGTFYAVWGVNTSNIVAVGTANKTIRYDGNTWTSQTGNGSYDIYDIWGDTNGNYYTSGDNKELLVYTGSWYPEASGGPALKSIFVNADNHRFAVGDSGTLFMYTTASWNGVSSNTSENLKGVWADNTSAFAVGTNGEILYYQNSTWSVMTSGTAENLYGVWGESSQLATVVGANGICLRYDGTNWSPMSVPVSSTLNDIYGLSRNRLFAVGDQGKILTYAPLDHITTMDTMSDPIALTIVESDPDPLTVTLTWANASLLTSTSFYINNIQTTSYTFTSTAFENDRLTLTIMPLTGMSGSSVITMTVTDATGLSSVETILFQVIKGPVVRQPLNTIATGFKHTLAIDTSGQLYAWGSNEKGELGIGTSGTGTEKYTPNAVSISGKIVAVAGSQNDGLENHTIALKSDGTVWTWGSNSNGQIGDGTFGPTNNQTTPVQVEGLSAIVSVDAGKKFCVVLDDTGTVQTWGDNAYGQVNPVDNTDRYTPVTLSGLPSIKAIAAGGDHVLALKKDGTVLAWGRNDYGQLGTGDSSTYSTPQAVLAESSPGQLSHIIAIAAGYDHSLALSDEGKIWAWGRTDNGRLGNNMNSSYSSRPTRVLKQDLLHLNNVIAIAAGFSHSIALKSDGTVWAWGDAQYGQLGDDIATDNTKAVQVKNVTNNGYIDTVLWIATSGKHTIALKSDGSLVTWGRNDYGQIGDNSNNTRYYPATVNDLTDSQKQQSVSISQNAVSSDIHLLLTDAKATVVQVTATAADASLVDAIAFSRADSTYTITQAGHIIDLTLAVTATGQAGNTTVTVLFTDSYGLTSTAAIDLYVLAPPVITSIDNTSTNEDTASSAISFTISDGDTNVNDLIVTASSSDTTLIPDDNINITCSGGYCTATVTPALDQSGSATITITVSDGSSSVSESFALDVISVNDPPRLENTATKIVGSFNHSMALNTDGNIWVWGNNSVGQLGITPLVTQYTPVLMTAIDSVIDIAVGSDVTDNNHSLAVKSDGTVWTWGYNLYGQLGNNACCTSEANSVTPVQVLNITGVTHVAGGANHSLALKSEGTVWAWGYNDNGQMGNGTSGAGTACYSPVQVSGLNTIKAIAAGGHHSLALKQDGTVWAWGLNTNGQLGDNSTTERNTPVQVVGPGGNGYLNDIMAIRAGLQHNIALKNDGTVWGWGYNSEGQLGQGSTYMYSMYPVQVVGVGNVGYLTGVVGISAGLNHSLALLSNGTSVAWGIGSNGQLGNNNSSNQSAPVTISLNNVQTISAGGNHSFAIESDGTLWSWGSNSYYQLGDNTMTERYQPVQPKGNDSDVFFNIGTYFPSTLTMSEDTVARVVFSVMDPDSTNLTMTVSSSNQTILKDSKLKLITVNNQSNAIVETISLGTSLPITLSIQPETNLNGNVVITVNTYDDSGSSSHTLTVTILNTPDRPAFNLPGQWTLQETPVSTNLNGIWAHNKDVAYAVGDNNVILRYSNNQWEQVTHGYTANFYSVWGYGADNIIAVGTGNQRIKYNGSTWSQEPGSGSYDIYDIWGDDIYGYYYTVGDNGEILEFMGSWNNYTYGSHPLHSIFANTNSQRFAVGDNGTAWIYANASWSAVSSNTSSDLNSVWADNETAVAVGMTGEIIQYQSNSWSAMTSGTSEDLMGVWGQSMDFLTAVGTNGSCLRYDGTNWSPMTVPVSSTLNDIYGLSRNRLFAVGDQGKILTYAPLDHITTMDTMSDPIALTIVESDPDPLTVTLTWANASLLTSTSFYINNIQTTSYTFTSTAFENDRLTLTIMPLTGMSGSSVITMTVTDATGLSSVETILFQVIKGPVVRQPLNTIATGFKHTLAIDTSGQLYAWGSNEKGELGIGTSGTGTEKYTPNAVSISGKIVAVAGSQNDGLENHTIALKSDGTVWTWGSNSNGQIGDGTFGPTNNQTTPVQVEGLSAIVSVDAGKKFCVVLDDTGTVQTWGDNAYGQVNPVDNTDRYTPVTLSGLPSIKAIAAGGDHVLALKKDGTVLAWGRNDYGQLGTGDSSTYSTPQAVLAESSPGQLSHIIAIAAGYDHSLALSDEGKIWAWGRTDNGRLGNNMNSSYSSRPTRVLKQDLLHLNNVIAIAAGFSHSIALKSDGTVWAWGDAQYGQLGDDIATDNTKAVQVKNVTNNGYIDTVLWIATSGKHTIALKSDGSLVTWGRNDYGQIGDNSNNTRYYPATVNDLTDSQKQQSVSISQNAVSSDIHLLLTDAKATVVQVTATAADASLVDAIAFSRADSTYTITQAGHIIDLTLAVTATGQAGNTTVTVLFTDSYGLTSTAAIDLYVLAPPVITSIDNTSTNEDTASSAISFTITDGDTNVNDLLVTANSSDTTLIPDDNINITCSNGFCTLTITPANDQNGEAMISLLVSDGIASVSTSFTITVTAVNDPPRFKQNRPKIVGGSMHTLLMNTNQRLMAWGDNEKGELGINTYGAGNDALTPVYVHNLTTIVDMDAGKKDSMGTHSIVVDSEGYVWTWGDNDQGQLGSGNSGTAKYSPVQLTDIADVEQVEAGYNFSAALKTDGTVWTWGDNYSGQLGIGTSGPGTNAYTPVQVTGLNSVQSIAAGFNHMLALKDDGTVWGWGLNDVGQLGIDNITNQISPVQVKAPGGVSFLTNVVAISAGYSHSMALKNDGTVWTWGENNNGQLGDNSGSLKQLPVQVKSADGNDYLNSIVDISTTHSHCLALDDLASVYAWGSGSSGQLGDGTASNKSIPIKINGLIQIVAIGTGNNHSLAIGNDGAVWAWGANDQGQLGINSNSMQYTPSRVLGIGTQYMGSGIFVPTEIAMNEDTSRFLLISFSDPEGATITVSATSSDNSLLNSSTLTVSGPNGSGLSYTTYCAQGQFCELTLNLSPEVNQSGTTVLSITADDGITQTIHTIDLSVKSVPDPITLPDIDAQMTATDTALNVIFGITNIDGSSFTVSSGSSNLSLVHTDNIVLTGPDVSGSGNIYTVTTASESFTQYTMVITPETGQSGSVTITLIFAESDGTTITKTFTVTINSGPKIFQHLPVIDGGYDHSVALHPEGIIYTWGGNDKGQLGTGENGSGTDHYTPTQITEFYIFTKVSAGQDDTGPTSNLALLADGTVWGWGNNGYAQLGDGTTTNRNELSANDHLWSVKDISVGGHHSMALQTDGTVWTWGDNDHGQQGRGTTGGSLQLTPAVVSGLANVRAIAAGHSFCMALQADGTVKTWGQGGSGQLGNNMTGDENTPIQVSAPGGGGSLTNIVSIAAGAYHAIALRNDGTVWTWGMNGFGQLGDGFTMDQSLPVQVHGVNNVGFLENIVMIAAGDSHSLALKRDGTVYAWGYNINGQLGNNDTNTNRSSPIQVHGTDNSGYLEQAIQIAAGYHFSMAVLNSGEMMTWGNNTTGNIGDGSTTERPYPVLLTDMAAKNSHYFRIPEGGNIENIRFWLSNPESDQLTVSVQSSDNAVIPYTQIYVRDNAYADLIDMTAASLQEITLNVYSNSGLSGEISITLTLWNNNNQTTSTSFTVTVAASPQMSAIPSQTTTEDTAIGPIAFTISDADTSVNDLSIKAFSSDESLVNNGNITFSGSGSSRFVSLSPNSDQSGECSILIVVNDGVSTAEQSFTVTVTPVNDAPSFSVLKPLIAAGNQHSVIVKTDGSVWTWGTHLSGQLGIGDTGAAFSLTPVETASTPKFEMIDAGHKDYTQSHILAVDNTGSIWGWGSNDHGQLGQNPLNKEIFAPQQITNLSDVRSIAAGAEHSIALKNDGTVWTWGYNNSGQLGLGTSGNESYTPTQVTGIGTAEQIAAGAYFSMALMDDGTVWTWGKNDYKQLGDGSSAQQNSPVQVRGENGVGYLTGVTDISAGHYFCFALKNDRSVWAWGKDMDYQLGDGDNVSKLYPVPVHGVNDNGFLTDVVDIISGYSHSLALKIDGSLVAWGNNSYEKLGCGSSTTVSAPVAVQGLTEVMFMDVGIDHSIAYRSDGSVWTWGNNNAGQLGEGTTSAHNIPVQVMNPLQTDHFNIGAFLPDTKICFEEENRVIYFSVSDPEGGIVTLYSGTSDNELLPSGNVYFMTASGNFSTITLTLAAGEAQLISLHVSSGYDQYGTGNISLTVVDSESASYTKQLGITVENQVDPIAISTIPDQITSSDTAVSFVIRITQVDAFPLTICGLSSDIAFVADSNISITGSGAISNGNGYTLIMSNVAENYTATIVPETGVSGSCRITFTVVSPTGMTAVSAFNLTIVTNGSPAISLIEPQITLENLSVSLIFSITDTIDGMMSLTGVSSDSLLVRSSGLQLTHPSMIASSHGYTLAVTGSTPESITLTLYPDNDAFGNSQMTITITNSFGLTATESFMLTIVEAGSRSIVLDGINDHVISDAIFTEEPTDGIAAEAWIYLYTNTTDMTIVSYGNYTHDSFSFEHGSNNIEMHLKDASNSEFVSLYNSGAPAMPVQRWHHVCAIWNNTANKGRLYWNGQLRYEQTFSSSTIGYSDTRQLFIGSWFGQNKWFKGRLDEIRIWKTALQGNTIQEWMFKPLTDSHPNMDQLVAYYPFSAVGGIKVFDTHNNYHGFFYDNMTIGVGPVRSQLIPFNNWIGSISNDWNEPANWDANGVPTLNNPGFTVINDGIRTPILSAQSSVNNLVLFKGASYQASVGNPLAVYGKLYNKVTGATIDIGGSMTIFSSTDFKTDRIAPESVDYSITATSSATIHLQWEQATDDQTSSPDLEYAVVMSTYSQNCVDTLAHVAENISPCAIETVIPFQIVSGSGTGDTIRSAGGNLAEVDISGLESGEYYFNIFVRDEMNNLRGYEAVHSTQ
ncbi:MAG: hypothetical protein HQK75_05900, partial [Candidatus Magnetomorum sp.]|nr:hypothetical protein [Candidatus Magnetomorum sp.]